MPDTTPNRSGHVLVRPAKVLPSPEATKLKLWVSGAVGYGKTRKIPKYGVVPVADLGMPDDGYAEKPAHFGFVRSTYRPTSVGAVPCFAINVGTEIVIPYGGDRVLGTFDLALTRPRYVLAATAERSRGYFWGNDGLGMLPRECALNNSFADAVADYTVYRGLPGFRIHYDNPTSTEEVGDGLLRVKVIQDFSGEFYGKVKTLPVRYGTGYTLTFWPCDWNGTDVYNGTASRPLVVLTANILDVSPHVYGQISPREPNMPIGSLFKYGIRRGAYNTDADGFEEIPNCTVIDPPMDDPIGTVKLWKYNPWPFDTAIPLGWRQVYGCTNHFLTAANTANVGTTFYTPASGTPHATWSFVVIERYQ